ncbi:hypothetical protein TNCV_376531 [Trichonephila clavipes]|nr:hypothetical protein TNCV_376531 [Trichonephila clavipes]
MITKSHSKTVRTPAVIKKAKSLILKEYPPTQSLVASKLGMSSCIEKPIFEEEIPALFGEDSDKVEFHKDTFSSHTSESTAIYLAKKESITRITCNSFHEIPAKLPVTSTMNFCSFGFLKRYLGKWHLRTLDGLSRGME